MFSDIDVKPRMSEKKMTTGRLSPPSFTSSPCSAICLARSGAK